jgi:hypothetical protein
VFYIGLVVLSILFHHKIFLSAVSSMIGDIGIHILYIKGCIDVNWYICKSWISYIVFLTLNVLGSCMYCDSNLIVNFASLWPGAFCQFTIGLMGESGLCIVMSPLQVGRVGFIFMNFHLCSLLIRDVLVFRKCCMLF